MATYQACQVIGMPECRINLAHLVTYLAEAPKSTRAYEGYSRAEEAAKSMDELASHVDSDLIKATQSLEHVHGNLERLLATLAEVR